MHVRNFVPVLLACILLEAAPVPLFDIGKVPLKSYLAKCERVEDPAGLKGTLLRVTFPKFVEGKGQWPSVPIPLELLTDKSIKPDRDYILTIFNPLPEVVDVALCIRGKKGSANMHTMLQPNTWNHQRFDGAYVHKTCGDEVTNMNVFMTRPPREYVLLLKGVSLIPKSLPEDAKVPITQSAADFEDGLPAGWEWNNVKTRITDAWAASGKHSLELTYPADREGAAPWPSAQLWATAGGTDSIDWSLYDEFQFTLYNPGTKMIPLKLMLADVDNNRSSYDCLLSPGQVMKQSFNLRTSSLKLNRMRQADFYITRPETDYTFMLDDVRLTTNPEAKLDTYNAELRSIRKELASLTPGQRQKYKAELDAYTKEIEHSRTLFKNNTESVAEIRRLNAFGDRLASWFKTNSRALKIANIVNATISDFPGAKFGVAVADSMTKVMIVDQPLERVEYAKNVRLELARNENESVQIVILGDGNPVTAGVKVSTLKRTDGVALPVSAVTVSLVGYVKTEKPPYRANYQGWWPDPLLDYQKSARVAPGEAVPFLVRIKAPEDAKPGLYTGNITVSAPGCPDVTLGFTVRVFDFAVPSASPIRTAIDFRDHINVIWKDGMTPERHEQLLNRFVDMLADYKIDLDSIYRRPKPGAPEKLNLYIPQLKYLRDKGLLRCFNITYFGTDSNVKGPDDPKVQKEINRVIETLDYWVPILRREGLLKYAYIYGYDEYPAKLFPVIAKVCKGIKAKYPDIMIATTAYDNSFGTNSPLGGAIDMFTPLTPKFDPQTVAKARARGTQVGWYICIGPHNPYANWFVEYDAIEARLLMGLMTAKYRPDWFLYYALSRWPVNKQPIAQGPYTNWNPASYKTANGDGSIFCAGPNGPLPTIRAENFRDGIEDYCYFLLLEKRIATAAPNTPKATLERAKAALAIGDELVKTMKQYTHDPKLLRAKRLAVAEAIESLK